LAAEEEVRLTANVPGFYLKFGQTEWTVEPRVPASVAMRAELHGYQTVLDTPSTVFYDASTGDQWAQKSLIKPEPPKAEPEEVKEEPEEEKDPEGKVEKPKLSVDLRRIATRLMKPNIDFKWG
jgi:hypothetical protein